MGSAKPSTGISLLPKSRDLAGDDHNLRKALVESRQRYKDLVEISSDFAWETDALARFSFVSSRGGLGWRPVDLVGRDVASFLDDPARCVIFATRSPISGQEIWFRRSDGDVACLTVAAKPLHDMAGDWIGARGVCRDITELRRHERDLAEARLHDNLMSRIVRTMRDELDPAAALSAAISATCLAVGATGGAVLRNSASAETDLAVCWGEAAPAHALDATQDGLQDAVSSSLISDELNVIGHAAQFRQERQGAIVLWKPEDRGAFNDDDVALLADVADYLGVALAQIVSMEQIVTLSRTDPLTALFNRRAFLEELDRRMARLDHDGASRGGGTDRGGALLFIDLDNFKRVNDEFGHAAGDRALCSVADALRKLCRSTDLIARLGGDEFVVWIDCIGQAAALRRARSLLGRFVAQSRSGDGASRMLGMSIGIAFANSGQQQSASKIIARADAAMYRAKQAGKRTVMVAPDEDVPAATEEPT